MAVNSSFVRASRWHTEGGPITRVDDSYGASVGSCRNGGPKGIRTGGEISMDTKQKNPRSHWEKRGFFNNL
jgi:hypothetical protein